MKGINEILQGYNLTDEQISTISKEVVENYRSIVEIEKKDQRIKELTEQVDDLGAKVSEASEAGAKVDELQALIDEYKAKDEQRRVEAEEAARRNSFQEVFDAAVGDREFANDLMRETVFEKVYNACKNDAGVGAKDALNSVTKDVAGVWVNPQHDPRKMPGANNTNTNNDAARTKRAFVRELFGSGS